MDIVTTTYRSEPGPTDQEPSGLLSPRQRVWRRFKRGRLGYLSFCTLLVLIAVSVSAPLLSNEHPLLARYQGKLYVPISSIHRSQSLAAILPCRPAGSTPPSAKYLLAPQLGRFYAQPLLRRHH